MCERQPLLKLDKSKFEYKKPEQLGVSNASDNTRSNSCTSNLSVFPSLIGRVGTLFGKEGTGERKKTQRRVEI